MVVEFKSKLAEVVFNFYMNNYPQVRQIFQQLEAIVNEYLADYRAQMEFYADDEGTDIAIYFITDADDETLKALSERLEDYGKRLDIKVPQELQILVELVKQEENDEEEEDE